jgi:hypothetical protein
MRNPESIGGRAAAQGIDYEERVAAWSFTQLLASGSVQRFGLNAEWRTTAVWMQAPVAAGDVVLEHSGGGAIYLQAKFRKARVALNSSADGLLVQVLSQFAQHYFGSKNASPTSDNPWSRPFDSTRDRFVLVVPSTVGVLTAQQLAGVLNQLREPDAWRNAKEKFNAAENTLIKTLTAAAKVALSSTGMSDPQGEAFLASVSVMCLDLSDDSAGAAEARLTLESSVLPENAVTSGAATWDVLRQIAREANRGGLRLTVLDVAAKLQAVGISLRAPRAFGRSIDQLKRITDKNLKRLHRYAELRVSAEHPIEIPRNCAKVLRGSLTENRVVIGKPGAGKSGVIYQVCRQLIDEGRDVVLLLADDLQASSERPLREVLGLDADLPEVLAAWFGEQSGHLVIDALDAARDAKIAQQLRSAMELVIAEKSRWRILASVRRFDLKHSPETKELFPGNAVPDYQDAEFNDTAHFDVPELSDSELQYAGQQNVLVGTLLKAARSHAVSYSLLRQPFNLSLTCELLRARVAVAQIVPFDSNTALLDRFWNHRVTDSQPRGSEREAVLSGMVDELVKHLAMRIRDERSLSNRALVAELLACNVLDQAAFEDGEIRFSHHLLHDYAVSRLLFRSHDTAELVEKLTARPELSVYARQSLLLHFDYLWDGDPSRAEFWNTSLTLLRSTLPLVARILSTECAVMNIGIWQDFSPLLQAVESGDETASMMLRFCVSGFLDIEEVDKLRQVGPVWTKLAVHLSERLVAFHWQVHLLLFKLVPDRGLSDVRLAPDANLAARLLAQTLLKKARPDERLGPDFLTALRVLCQTADAAPAETDAALRPLLEKRFAEEYGDRVYWVLAEKMKCLVRVLPELVRDFYIAVFANETAAEGWDSLGNSKIMPMQIKRSDNYNLARHRLHGDFAVFFHAAPVEATVAVVRFMPLFRAREHPRASGEKDVRRSFRFRNRSCHLVEDFSSIWAADSSIGIDDAVAVVRALRNGWVDLAKAGKFAELERIFDVLAKQAELAVLWRTLLDAGARVPDSLGIRISALLAERAILLGMDTHHPATSLLGGVFKHLSKTERAKIERAIVGLPKSRWKDRDGKIHTEDTWRGRYLNQLNPRLMVTKGAKELRRTMLNKKQLRENEPPFRSWGGTSSVEWADYVPSLRGVDLKTPPHLAAREWENKLRSFERSDGKKLTVEGIDAFWPQLLGAYEFVVTNPPAGLHRDVAALVWAHLVSAAEAIVSSGVMPTLAERRSLLLGIIRRAATDPKPELQPDSEASFARGPSWGSPNPRIDAAEALIVWPRETRQIDDGIRAVIRALAADQHPAVRFQIASSCNALYEVDQSFMWELIRDRTAKEQNAGVWTGLLSVIDRIAPGHHDEAAALFTEFLRRFPRKEDAPRDPADIAVAGLGNLFIRYGHHQASACVLNMIREPVVNAHDLGRLCHHFRDTLAVGLLSDSSDYQRALHQRGVDFFLQLVRSARVALDRLMALDKAGTRPPENDFRSILQLLDGLNMQVFFASGAHDAKKSGDPDDGPPPPIRAFWQETKPIIDELVSLPSAHIAYHLAETLEYLIPADPAEIFRCIAKVVANSKADGFAHESLAVGVISRIVERYLADYSALFTKQKDLMQDLLQVLDTFADVGWPEARRLIRNLSRLYR